ncbi:hypothetical protein [Silanimonas sp.]|jgi:hypothetical protein|uniref:hypothetical protein n=1 Tax=Silanimonas sp. TaxID=1929290 RepID=UPI0037C8DEB0
MPRILSVGLMALAGVVLASPSLARPISYAGGHMLMVEHEPDVDRFSYTYSPSHRWSVSAGGVRADGLERTNELELGYVRASRLLHRWNLPAAQANAFVWGGVGQGRTALGDGLARHVGLQLDYETRRIYTSLVTELHEGDGWSHRFDTAAIGWAPYEHDIDRVATWVVLKGMRTTNAIDDDIKPVAVLRFFTTRWWLEVGADADGQPLANVMINL